MSSFGSTDTMTMEEHMTRDSPTTSSRILDIPCKVCGDFSSGKHYNIFACDGCAGFFKRSIRRNREYVCKAKEEGKCLVDKTHRNQCRACRLAKCHEVGMNKDAVQHERGPRSSTLRRQQMCYDPRERFINNGSALDLAMTRSGSSSPCMDSTLTLPIAPSFMFNPVLPVVAPAPMIHSMINPAAICEYAARLLFMNVQWTKTVPHFTNLAFRDQLIMLEESWKELFILSASQFLLLDLSSLVRSCKYLEREPDRAIEFLQNVRVFQDTLVKLAEFHFDPQEFSCLKTIILFKCNLENPNTGSLPISSVSNNSRALQDRAVVVAIHEHTQLALNKYIASMYPTQPLRFGKMLMLISTLKLVPGEVIEELFFRQSIGSIPIVRIIGDVYKSQQGCI